MALNLENKSVYSVFESPNIKSLRESQVPENWGTAQQVRLI